MTTETKTPKVRVKKTLTANKRVRVQNPDYTQMNLRIPITLAEQIEEFMQNATPSQRKAINAASLRPGKLPHESVHQAFMAYAVHQLLNRNNAPRLFGSKIEEDVAEVMAQNLKAFETNPHEWWNLTAIGSNWLRDKGHNPNSVKRWIEENAARLGEHHASVGITDPQGHNRKAGKAKKFVQP